MVNWWFGLAVGLPLVDITIIIIIIIIIIIRERERSAKTKGLMVVLKHLSEITNCRIQKRKTLRVHQNNPGSHSYKFMG